MKNIAKTLLLTIVSFLFVGMVNAAEAPLNSVGVITSDVGGSNKSIIETDTANQGKYTYYYTIRQIGDADFNTYVKQKYIYDNAQEGTTEKVNAANQISNLETNFKQKINTVNSASDFTATGSGWKQAQNGIINLTGLVNTAGSHNGYVLAVAAVKNGDSNIYIDRVIKESKSATTLGDIAYLDSDKTAINNVVPETNTTTTPETNTATTDTVTKENPETAVSDWAIFITPISIALGSGILLRRKSYA